MRQRNKDIRKSIEQANLMMHEVAESLGVSESTFYRWLRQELPDEKRKKILAAIETAESQISVVAEHA